MERENNNLTRHLFLCDQTLEFFNIIVILQKMELEGERDIVFSDKNDFSKYENKVKETGLFSNIYNIKIKDIEKEFWDLNDSEKYNLIVTPKGIVSFPEYTETYTDIWINIDSVHAQLQYYNCINNGMNPKIHLICEGIGNYTRKISDVEKNQEWHEEYKENSYYNHVLDNYIYMPELYVGEPDIELQEIPRISQEDKELHDILTFILGKGNLPKEKYIFFETPLYDMGIMNNELELFENIAEIVGKENIIVKRHPRNSIDRFSCLGYKVLPNSILPWEALLVNNYIEVQQKIGISIFSQTCFSPFLIFDIPIHIVCLLDLMRHPVHWYARPEWVKYHKNFIENINMEKIQYHCPNNQEELIYVMEYLKNFNEETLDENSC